MINDYTRETNKPLGQRIEKFTSSQALNLDGEFTYGARIVRRELNGQHVYEKYRGGYTKVHPDYYLIDISLRHAQVEVTQGDIELFESAIKQHQSEHEEVHL